MSELRLRNLSKKLGGRTVVDDVTLTVPDGRLMVLLGSSGCGKTTTLRMICGLEAPDSGQVLLGGRDITALPPQSRELGMVFQDYGLYPAMDVRANIAYGLQARNLPKAQVEQRVTAAAAQLGLTEKLGRMIGELSGGEQQRVALARALAKDAEAFLFDEPLSNLDPKLRHQARRDVLTMHRLKGKPSVYITHDQNEAFAIADLIAVMSDGRIRQVGTPEDLIERPADTFVAGFIGEHPMNLLTVAVKDEGRPAPLIAGVPVELPADLWPLLAGRASVVLGVLPSAIGIGAATYGRGGELTGEVVQVEPLISETVLRLVLPDGNRLTVVADLARDPEVGDTVTVGIDPARVRIFDPATGLSLH